MTTNLIDEGRYRASPENRTERAQRAVKVFRSMQPTLTSYARAITGKRSLSVQIDDGPPRTDGKTIFFKPPIELGDLTPHNKRVCDKRDRETMEQLCLACRVREVVFISIVHEIAHIAFGTFEKPSAEVIAGALDRAIEESGTRYAQQLKKTWENLPVAKKADFLNLGSLISPYLPLIINGLEDVRVDENMFKARKGTRVMFDAYVQSIFRSGIEEDDGTITRWSEKPLNSQILIGVFILAAGYNYKGWLHPEVEKALGDKTLRDLCKRIETIRSAQGSYELAFPILARLRELGFCRKPEEQNDEPIEEPQSDSSDENEDQDKEEGEGNDEGDSSGEGEDENEQEGQADGAGGNGTSDESSASEPSEAESDSEQSSGTEQSSGHSEDDSNASTDPVSGDNESESESPDGDSDDDLHDPGSEGDDESDDSTGEGGDGSGDSELGGKEANDAREASSDEGEVRDDRPSESEASEGGSGSEDGADEEEFDSNEELDSNESGIDAVDSGADTGHGGTEVEEYNYGTAEEAIKDAEAFGQHEVVLSEADNKDPAQTHADEKAITVAIIQGQYFEAPSANITGVREHKWSEVNSDQHADAWKDPYNQYSARRLGTLSNTEVPEAILGPALTQMRKTFADNQRANFQRNLKSGRVASRSLGKRAPFHDPRLFQKKRIPGKRSYAVLIGIDISGSTMGVNIALAKRAAMAQAELCSRMGIDFAVYAHTANGEYHFSRGTIGISDMYLDVYEIKAFDQPWNDDAKTALARIGSDSENLDGHTIEYYRKMIERHPATDKIILYYSDGKMPAANHDEELEILIREINYCRRKQITLMGVGIRTDSPRRHGLNTVQVDDDNDLVKVVRHLETALLHSR